MADMMKKIKHYYNRTLDLVIYGLISLLKGILFLLETRDINLFFHKIKLKMFIIIGKKNIWKIRAIIANIKKRVLPKKYKIKFLTFYTQGEPYDEGINLQAEAYEYINRIKPFVDEAVAVSAFDLSSNCETAIYVKKFDEEAKWNFKTNKIGFLRWKPYIILKQLESINDGDVVFYRDCNITKYPNILDGIHHTRKYVDIALKSAICDVFAPVENYPLLKVKNNVKRELLESFNLFDEKYVEEYLKNASLIICRKSKESISFLNKWLSYCMDDELISPKTVITQHPEFLHNTQEQAIMNCVFIQAKEGISNRTAELSIIDRCFNKDMVKVPRVAVLLCGQMRNFDNEKLLEMNVNNFWKHYNCDVFVSVWDDRGYSFNHGISQESDYANNHTLAEERVRELLNKNGSRLIAYETESFDTWLSNQNDVIGSLYNKGMNIDGRFVKATSFPQLYKLYRANKLKEEYSSRIGLEYDLVFRVRPDMGFVETVPQNTLYDSLRINSVDNAIYHLNPPKIFYPNRIYDIFFWGKNESMNSLCNAWLHIEELLDSDYDNGLPKVDCCRLLYIQAVNSGLHVIDEPRCIGDIYRDEDIDDYKNKILTRFN